MLLIFLSEICILDTLILRFHMYQSNASVFFHFNLSVDNMHHS